MKTQNLTTCTLAAILMVGLLTGCQKFDYAGNWYRGNTHTHTVICGHADSPPDLVAAWYHDHGYQFVILSEHNHFIDPATVNLPEPTREDFILVPGVEVTGHGYVHTTAMNVGSVPPWQYNNPDKSLIVQNHVDGILEAGGEAILNHPNFGSGVAAEHMRPVNNLHMFELFNGHPHVHSHGNEQHPSTEAMWDELLTDGMLIYGVSSDDAHHFQRIEPNLSNPGRGWVMVNAAELTGDSITEAMMNGEFYASNGVFLTICHMHADTYMLMVNTQRTADELTNNPLLRGKAVDEGEEGYRIEFIGPGGEVLHEVQGTLGQYSIDDDTAYVRARVTYTRQIPDGDGLEEYYAWGQPVFTDERAEHDH